MPFRPAGKRGSYHPVSVHIDPRAAARRTIQGREFASNHDRTGRLGPSREVVDVVVEPATDDSDRVLIAAAQRGDRSALERLVGRHDRWIRGVVYSTLGRPGAVDDVVQQVWTNVWQQIGTLNDRARWRSWLFRLARNAAIDAGERQSRERRVFVGPVPGDKEPPAADKTPVFRLIEEEQYGRILRAIRALPAIYREPFVLRHLEDWNYQQIGEALGMPVDTVETRLVRARRLLREMMAAEAKPS